MNKYSKKELIELISNAIGKQADLKKGLEGSDHPQIKETYIHTKGVLEALHAVQQYLRYNNRIDLNFLIK